MKIITPLIIIAICIGMYFLYIGPTYSEIGALSAQSAEYANVLAQSKQLTAERDQVLTKYNSIPTDDVDKLNKILPATFDSVTFANNLNALASQDNLAITDIKVNETPTDSRDATVTSTDTNPYNTTAVVVTLSGAYPDFVQFLKSLESSLELVDVASLNITPTLAPTSTLVPAKVSDLKIEYTMELDTYSLK